MNLLDVTDITQSAHSRLGGLRDGTLDITTYFDGAAGQAHAAFSALPATDVIMTYLRGQVLQNPAACLNAKQVGYDPTRAADGSLTLKVAGNGNAYGLEWGEQLTAGLRADTTGTVGAFIDDLAGTSFGGQAYFQLVAFTGTSVTIDIQSCTTSGGSYATTGLTSSALVGIGAQRVAVANNTTINRYLKVVTTGTFSVASFQVTFVRNKIAGQVF